MDSSLPQRSQSRQSYRSSNSHQQNHQANNNAYNGTNGDVQEPDSSVTGRFTEEWDASQRGSSIVDGRRGNGKMQRSSSVHSFTAGDDQHIQQALPSRGNTLKKKNSMRRSGGSVRRSSSRRSMKAGSVRSLALQSASDPDEMHSVFYCPVPTTGNPTEVLCSRFQTWRKVLKDLIAYFREVQNHYEHRSKSLVKLANVSNNISTPPGFLSSAGIDDALQFLRSYHKNAILEAGKAKEIEEDVILALTGLRSDLQQKIKEIKNLSGDFKNSVEKEMDNTGKVVRVLTDALGKTELDSSTTTGKQDPFLLRLAVDRQVERQVDEENYLHQAYLNLESSGRELEAIVVGEIQKAYNAYAGILKREADSSYSVVEELRDGPVSMPKDQEWIHFVTHDEQFLDPTISLRSSEQMHYPGQDHLAAQEIRAGLLERKSKYLKSYTAGWYVLSSTHLHEFKSADKAQAPVMSLYLPEQKLGSHSTGGGSSNKFILKGRQTGSMHRGHTWVFRAESHDTMMAWYEDIKALTEKTAEERHQFVRSHSRSLSRSSRRSVSSDGMVDDEDDEPFSASSQIDVNPNPKQDATARRLQPGGRFPSDIQVNAQRGLQAPQSPSVSSQDQQSDANVIAAAGALPGTDFSGGYGGHQSYDEHQQAYGGTALNDVRSTAATANQEARHDGVNPYTSEPLRQSQTYERDVYVAPVVVPGRQQQVQDEQQGPETVQNQNDSRQVSGLAAMSSADYSAAQAQPEPFNQTTTAPQNANGESQAHTTIGAVGMGDYREADTDSQLLAETPGASDFSPVEPAPVRPSAQSVRHDSVQTISNLHIPGGYPRPGVTDA